MPVLRIHIEHEEFAAIERRAGELGITAEQLGYGAISCSMNHCREPACRERIESAIRERARDLPLWSDKARSVGIYQGMHDIEQGPGPRGEPL